MGVSIVSLATLPLVIVRGARHNMGADDSSSCFVLHGPVQNNDRTVPTPCVNMWKALGTQHNTKTAAWVRLHRRTFRFWYASAETDTTRCCGKCQPVLLRRPLRSSCKGRGSVSPGLLPLHHDSEFRFRDACMDRKRRTRYGSRPQFIAVQLPL